MSEEVTYADLKFQDSSKRENMVAFEKLETKACPAPSRVWHLRVLTFLCLLLLISLGVLGGMFYVTFKQHVEEVNKLQKVKDELQGNVSLQMMNNTNNTMMIGKLSCTLQEMARELCRKLYEKDQEHKCKPCPSRWIWHDDKCYLFNVDTTETWQDSKKKCWNQNATLLTIRNKSVLEFLKSHTKKTFWLRLSLPIYMTTNYPQNFKELFNSSDWLNNNNINVSSDLCGYSHKYLLYFVDCSVKKHFICEKMANPVKIESVLMNKVPDRRC